MLSICARDLHRRQLDIDDPRHHMQLHPQLHQQSANLRLYQRDIVKARVPMSREINVPMGTEPICNFKKFVRAERDVFFSRCIASIVAHDAADIAKSQKQIRFF